MIVSPSEKELTRIALVELAPTDPYQDWLLSRRGTVSKGIDIEI